MRYMIELTWKCLIISIILLFGINIGLAMGLTKKSKKNVLVWMAAYCISILILSNIIGFRSSLYGVFNNYIPEILGLMGIVTVLSGIYTILQWRKNKKEYNSLFSFALLSSSICGFIGMLSTFILLNKTPLFSTFASRAFMLGTLLLLVMVFYSFSKFLRKAERPYPVVLGNFMILNGFYFIIAATFIPNLDNLAKVQMNPFSIDSVSSLFFMIIALLGILLLGVYLQNRALENKNQYDDQKGI